MDILAHAPRSCATTDEYGLPLSHIIERLTGNCVYGWQGTLSWYFGYLSLLCWIQAQFPQIILNLQRSSTEGLSPLFLCNWMVGDLTNLVGCILTHQLPFQTLLATYYCFIDSCLVFQYLFYDFRRCRRVVIEGTEPPPSPRQPRWKPSLHSSIVLFMITSNVAAAQQNDDTHSYQSLGIFAAWLSSILYFTSRLPQIYTNYTRKSTDGISVLLFIAAFCGNVFYTASIIVSPLAWPQNGQSQEDAAAFISNALPFLIGSAGTLCFDLIIVSQWLYYNKSTPWMNYEIRVERLDSPLIRECTSYGAAS